MTKWMNMRGKMNILRYEYESEDDFMLKSLGFFNTGESKWNSRFVKEGLHVFILLK